jgi:hypothetical protein
MRCGVQPAAHHAIQRETMTVAICIAGVLAVIAIMMMDADL